MAMSRQERNLTRMAVSWVQIREKKGRLFSDGLFYLGIGILGVKGEVL